MIMAIQSRMHLGNKTSHVHCSGVVFRSQFQAKDQFPRKSSQLGVGETLRGRLLIFHPVGSFGHVWVTGGALEVDLSILRLVLCSPIDASEPTGKGRGTLWKRWGGEGVSKKW